MSPRGSKSFEKEAEALILPPDRLLKEVDLATTFPDTQSLHIDLGCGTGRFLIRYAEKHPEFNMLGIERLLGRARKVARKVWRRELPNVRLIRAEGTYVMQRMLPAASVSAVFVLFPDPWPKRRHHHHRLIQPAFLDGLDRVLLPDGIIHLATDDAEYHLWMRNIFSADHRFKEVAPFEPDDDERTSFELIWREKGKTINRLSYARS